MSNKTIIMGLVVSVFTAIILLMQGCAKDENYTQPYNEENIGFASATGGSKVARGTSITIDNLYDMGVFAYVTDSEAANSENYGLKMFHAKYYKSYANYFKPAETQPNGSFGSFMWTSEFHHFYAYAPFNAEGVETDATTYKVPSIKFLQTSNDPTTHVDLLYSNMLNTLRPQNSALNMNLEHALSKVTLSAKNSSVDQSPYIKINMKSVKFGNISQSAVLKFYDDKKGAEWIEHSGVSIYTFDAGGIEVGATKTEILGDESNSTLFLIPQNLNSNSAYITVEYEYAGFDKSQTVLLPDNWEMGNAYNYILSIDPNLGTVEITAQLLDWENTEDIISEVTYSYLYLEKSTYSMGYTAGEEKLLDINFSTNVQDDILSIEYDSKGKPTGNEVELDKASRVIRAKFYPNKYYETDTITLITGSIKTKIKFEFHPLEVIDYSSVTEVNSILGITGDKLITSNSYFIKPSDNVIKDYYIPISDQISRFHTIDLTNINNWNVQTYAYDNRLSVNRLEYTKIANRNGKSCFKISIPEGYNNPGNIIVSVTDNSGKILWTWHLWITDYDPNSILKNGTHGTDIMYDNTGAVYRYQDLDYSCHMDRNIGAVAAGFEGQGELGGRGWLAYQYGRLAPIFGHQAHFADGTRYITNRVNTGRDGVSVMEAIQNPNAVYYNVYEMDWCNDLSTVGKVWNDNTIVGNTATNKDEAVYEKSIFDPSPLGWMIPPMGEYYVDGGWSVENNGHTYISSSGNKYYSTINTDPTTGVANIVITNYTIMWTNTDIPATDKVSAKAAGLRLENYATVPSASHDKRLPHTLGASIRPILQFKLDGSF